MYYKSPSLDNLTALQVGQALVELFNLKPNNKGLYETSFGTKTLIGLARCAERIMYDSVLTSIEPPEQLTEVQLAIEARCVVDFPQISYSDEIFKEQH